MEVRAGFSYGWDLGHRFMVFVREGFGEEDKGAGFGLYDFRSRVSEKISMKGKQGDGKR